jgi:hypothetical protein
MVVCLLMRRLDGRERYDKLQYVVGGQIAIVAGSFYESKFGRHVDSISVHRYPEEDIFISLEYLRSDDKLVRLRILSRTSEGE